MKKILLFSFLVFLFGCGKSEDDIRAIVQQELAKSASPQYFTNAQIVGPYTPTMKVGNLLFLSGQISENLQTNELINGTIEDQTKQAMENIMSLLRQAGYDSTNIVQCTIFLKEITDFSKMNLIYGGYFADGKYPTRNIVEVSNLPRDVKVEIAAIAWK